MKVFSRRKLAKQRALGNSGVSGLDRLHNEIAVLQYLRQQHHPGIISLHEVIDDPEQDNIVLGMYMLSPFEIKQTETDLGKCQCQLPLLTKYLTTKGYSMIVHLTSVMELYDGGSIMDWNPSLSRYECARSLSGLDDASHWVSGLSAVPRS